MTIVYLTDDLLFSSQIVSAAQNAQLVVEWKPTIDEFLKRWQELAADPNPEPTVAILDLGLRGLQVLDLVTTIRATLPAARIIAYGPHVQVERLAEAQLAGCSEVLARGAFSRDVVPLLQRHCQP